MVDRLAGFNAQRDQLLDVVRRRIVDRYVAAAARGGDESLEYILNDVAFSEIRRLEKSSDRNAQRRLQRWRDLTNRLLQMSDGDKRAELESLTDYYCRDIVGNFNPRVFRFASGVMPHALSFLLSPVSSWREGVAALTEVRSKVRVEGPIDQIQTLAGLGSLVVTPTHSSNMDSIVLALGLVLSDLPPVTYGAGKNLFTNPLISYFMRNLGAYRVDRRLRFRLYKDILKEYSTVLLENGYHSLFFPGGTRCRSNCVEKRLKLGLLSTALAAYQNNLRAGRPARRVYIAPITINYRLVLEAETMIDDYLAEAGKSRYIIQDDEFSRLGRVVEFTRRALAHEGAVILRFGTPLDPFGNRVDDDGNSRDRRGRLVDPATYVMDASGQVAANAQRDSQYTRLVGQSLMEAYHRDTVFLSTHVTARALMDVLARQAGTRDIYRLLRLAGDKLRVPLSALTAAVAGLRAHIASRPGDGVLSGRLTGLSDDQVVDDALDGLATYHTRPVAVRRGDDVWIESVKLLYYYQNRLDHIPIERSGGVA